MVAGGWGVQGSCKLPLRAAKGLGPLLTPLPLASFCLSVESRSCWEGGVCGGVEGEWMNTSLAAQRSGSVIKTAVSGGLGVIGIVNVESSWGRRRGARLCVKHTDTSAALAASPCKLRESKEECVGEGWEGRREKEGGGGGKQVT